MLDFYAFSGAAAPTAVRNQILQVPFGAVELAEGQAAPRWGFCVSQRVRDALPDGENEIQSTPRPSPAP